LNIKGCCQTNAWFDETVALKWVEEILEPYVREQESAFHLVDNYRVHFIGACNNIGSDVDNIPKGCTFASHPVDVWFNAPLKKYVKDKFRAWQILEYRANNNITKLPSPTIFLGSR
jgi:hypothetical protein